MILGEGTWYNFLPLTGPLYQWGLQHREHFMFVQQVREVTEPG